MLKAHHVRSAVREAVAELAKKPKTLRQEVIDFAWERDIDVAVVLEVWSERAAVREYLGGQGRVVAETNALDHDLPRIFR